MSLLGDKKAKIDQYMDGFGVWFRHFDKNNSGKIEKNEFAEFVT